MANKSKHMKKEDEKENVFKLDIGKNTRKRVVAKSTLKKKNKQKDKEEKFNFDNEIVIGVNVIPDVKKDKPSKNNKERSKKNNISKSNKSSNKKNEPKKSINKDNKNQKEKYRNKKNKLNVKKIIKIFLIIAITIGIAIFIMTTPLFNVTEIDISGNSRVSKERIESIMLVLFIFILTILYGNYKDIRTKLPIISSSNIFIKLVGYLVYTIGLFLVYGMIITI